MRAALHPVPTARLANHFRRPFSTIRHRRELDLRFRNYIANSECNIFRNLPGAERAFEFIRRDEDAHFQTFKLSFRTKLTDNGDSRPQLSLQNLPYHPRIRLSF